MNKNRLFWASRRGMLELDLILQPFVEKVFSELPLDDQRRYEQLLDCEDQDLFSWLLRSKVPDDESVRRIVDIVLASRDVLDSGLSNHELFNDGLSNRDKTS